MEQVEVDMKHREELTEHKNCCDEGGQQLPNVKFRMNKRFWPYGK